MNDIKKKNILIIIAILFIGLGIIGATYAYLTISANTVNDIYDVASHCFTIDYTIDNGDSTQDITGTLFPSGTINKGLSGRVGMKISNSCNLAGKGTIKVHIDSSTSTTLTTPASSYCQNRSTLEPISGISTEEACTTAGGRWRGYGDSYCESNTTYERLTNYTDSSSCASHSGTWTSGGSPLKYAVYDNASATGTPLSKGKILSTDIGNDITVYDNFSIDKTQKYYYIFIWLDGYLTDDNHTDLPFSGQVKASAIQDANAEPASSSSLPSFITESNAPLDSINSTYVQNSTPGIKWDEIASDTNGKGIYIRSGTENNTNPIYYYRGAVDNNNVYFGGFCWKIVRTTETGGLKMIYNGIPSSGSCGSGTISQSGASATIGNSKYNASYNDAKYVGYTYDNSGVETDSTIKGVIDTWYQNNLLTNYDSYLEDTVFCNDRSAHTSSEFTSEEQSAFYLTDSSSTYYGPLYRLAKKLGPSVTCPNNSDAYTKSSAIGNGKLTYPVGLLTSDEIWMAGEGTYYYGTSGTGYKNTTYYLQNNNYWWSLSPIYWYGSNAYVWVANSSVGLDYVIVGLSRSVRPVVSLKPGQNFEYGNGTVGNPYRFVSSVS